MTYRIMINCSYDQQLNSLIQANSCISTTSYMSCLQFILPDSSALYGLMTRFRDLHIEVISIINTDYMEAIYENCQL